MAIFDLALAISDVIQIQRSWDLGTCVPSTVLGTHGIISLNHSQIRSLNLTTDPFCHPSECDIDLSAFRQLRTLSWKGPRAEDLDALSVAILGNSAHLRKLELDLVSWPQLLYDLGISGDEEDEEDEDGRIADNYFTRTILCLDKCSPQPLLPAIRVLSLSQVPVSASMVFAVDFPAIESFTLRRCPGWDELLEHVLHLGLSIKLSILEIQETDDVTHGEADHTLAQFLSAFEGLQELFISHQGPSHTLALWELFRGRHSTLRRFVYHQRTIDMEEDSPYFEEARDLPDLSLIEEDKHLLRENPAQSPLAELHIECLGLACVPELWVRARNDDDKVVH